MKKLFVGAVVAALCGLAVPSLSLADGGATASPARSAPSAQPTAQQDPSGDDAASYAAREKKTPQLAEFQGGDSNGLYIGTGALIVVLAIVLLVTLM